MLNRFPRILALAAFLALLAGVATAEVSLRFAPNDTVLTAGSGGRLSIMCDDALDLRTVEVFVQFDPAIIGPVGGGAGALFTDTGFILFQGFELTAPDVWHGYCVVLGSEDYITGPGELFYWDFEALVDGVSPITTVSVDLAAPDATILPDVSLPGTRVTVGDPLSSVSDVPATGPRPGCFPNPFNPRTEVHFHLDREQDVVLAVFDPAGRRVTDLYRGHAPRGRFSAVWNGRDHAGRVQPGGTYLFRLETATTTAVTKGVLLK